ncbi:MAG TPA: cellulase family glycosylhydrolase [Streptosporangiaceae bacterium]|nr:cellulase family glycosylhydrolase [Streptosporangiaceae bacterium]
MVRILHRRSIASLAALLLSAAGLGGLSVMTSAPANAAAGCSVAYVVQSDWGSGFVTNLTITNLGSPITSWTLTYSYAGNQTVTNGWNGNWTQSGKNVTVTNAAYNGSLGTNGTANPGAQFSYSGSNVNPTSFALNGVTCTGQVTNNGGSIVANPTSLAVTQGKTGTFALSLSAAPSANVTLTTSRTSGNTGLSVTAGGSLTFTPSNFATPQNVTITADSASTGVATFTVSGTGFTSVSVTVNETPANSGGGPAAQLHVSGNKLLNASGQQVILRGINRSGGEYACVNGTGIFDGEMDQAAINAMKSWGVNAVRMPLNEACWNGESYVNSQFSGANYQNAIKSEVSLMNASGLDVILDLHWTDGTATAANCSSAQAVCQKPMPDAAQAIPFWSSVATAFKGNDAVIFDLFNEPFASRSDNNNTTEGWQCWETGSPCTGINYPVAGMQRMVTAVRNAGANNVIMLGGEEFSNDLTSWLQFEPTDPDHNLVASWHSYNFNTCSNQSCWTSQVAPVIAQVPVIAGEIGENDCAGSYINPLTTWLDSQNTSYLAWAWNSDFNCSSGPGLVTDYVPGTPTNYGAAYKAHLASLGLAPTS